MARVVFLMFAIFIVSVTLFLKEGTQPFEIYLEFITKLKFLMYLKPIWLKKFAEIQ